MSPKRQAAAALRQVTAKISQLKLSKIVTARLEERHLILEIDEAAWAQAEMLDGCYVIKSDLPPQYITAQQIHDRYKDLSKVERAFRTIKTTSSEIRPLFLRRADHTRGHVFMVMLSYLVIREIERRSAHLPTPAGELLRDLDRLTIQYQWLAPEVRISRIPKPTQRQSEFLQALEIKIPETICVPSKKKGRIAHYNLLYQ